MLGSRGPVVPEPRWSPRSSDSQPRARPQLCASVGTDVVLPSPRGSKTPGFLSDSRCQGLLGLHCWEGVFPADRPWRFYGHNLWVCSQMTTMDCSFCMPQFPHINIRAMISILPTSQHEKRSGELCQVRYGHDGRPELAYLVKQWTVNQDSWLCTYCCGIVGKFSRSPSLWVISKMVTVPVMNSPP